MDFRLSFEAFRLYIGSPWHPQYCFVECIFDDLLTCFFLWSLVQKASQTYKPKPPKNHNLLIRFRFLAPHFHGFGEPIGVPFWSHIWEQFENFLETFGSHLGCIRTPCTQIWTRWSFDTFRIIVAKNLSFKSLDF